MTIIEIFAILITISALFGYINTTILKLPMTIGLMVVSLIFSLVIIVLGYMGYTDIQVIAINIISQIDFNITLMQGMLSALLFAGALHVNLNDLTKHKAIISALASIGVISSTFMIGTATYYISNFIGVPISYIYALLFGALISPTDPIAVMGILKNANAPKSLETKIAGESLFNDGVAVVVFLAILGIATGNDNMDTSSVAILFLQETVGGAIFGGIIGYVVFLMLKSIDNYQVEILLTLALVFGGYSLASYWHLSGPIAIVVAGLLIGNVGRRLAMSKHTREHLDNFWMLIDEMLNAILFVLIGLEVLILSINTNTLLLGFILIPVSLLARFIAVGTPIKIMSLKKTFSPKAIKILTWGGLRGGISIALALSIPNGEFNSTIILITYVIVIFSILVQGLTLGKLVKS